jgi:branched-chain amino acid transport system ATP-binding protein
LRSDPLLSLREVSKSFGGLKAVQGVSFDLHAGEITSLVGPNGSGKTTLFNCINGIYIHDGGKICFNGEEIGHLSPARRCQIGISRTFQVVRPFLKMTCLENLLVARYFGHRGGARGATEDCLKILELVGLREKARHPASGLRLAERKRLEIARALASDPKLLLLDEVAAGLHPVEVQDMVSLLRQMHERGITLLVVEHVMSLVMTISNRVIVLNEGRKIAEGPPESVSCDSKVIEVYLGTSQD